MKQGLSWTDFYQCLNRRFCTSLRIPKRLNDHRSILNWMRSNYGLRSMTTILTTKHGCNRSLVMCAKLIKNFKSLIVLVYKSSLTDGKFSNKFPSKVNTSRQRKELNAWGKYVNLLSFKLNFFKFLVTYEKRKWWAFLQILSKFLRNVVFYTLLLHFISKYFKEIRFTWNS